MSTTDNAIETHAEHEDQSWEAKHYRAMRQVRMVEADCRTLMRLFFPQIAPQRNDVAAMYCHRCTPPPKVYTCPMCDWETEEQWRFSLHLSTRPGWCRERGEKKARAWARRV